METNFVIPRVEKNKSFDTISRTIQNQDKTILNYFDNRLTNASLELVNAKMEAFIVQLRGVRNVGLFLFIRLGEPEIFSQKKQMSTL